MNMNSTTPFKSRPPPGQQGSTPFRSASVNKFRSSLVPTSRPSPVRSLNPSTKLTKTSTSARDLFRTSTPQNQRTTHFNPKLPAEATRPNASIRKFAYKSVSSGMSNTASTEPFEMRIPSPDPDLTGEVLAKEIPDDPRRTGSIYADQFLAHKCPSHFDDLQRRQFFCILDLRRLKYAADEIFAKKDWKLNILNFAKEYEKSRGLIMLRYGLYEFKNVKPSEEVLKKWRATHGLPDPEPEEVVSSVDQSRRTAGPGAVSTKRKAEEELTPKDNTLMASTANQNKRRNFAQKLDEPVLTGPAPFKKSKRKADETEEPNENQPSKLQKSAPSIATSKFESILNKTQNGVASPPKPPSQASSLFGAPKPQDSHASSFATTANPFNQSSSSLLFDSGKTSNTGTSSGSVLSGHKIGSTPTTNTGNIFSYLSESSPGSSGDGNDNAEDDGGTESEPEHDSEEQEPSAAVSTGTSTPPVQTGPSLFATNKISNVPNIFGESSKPNEQTSKGGLFGRVQMGANGQPLRATPSIDEKQAQPATQPLKAEEQSKTPAKPPGDYTFNPATTPISFGQPTSSVSKSSDTSNMESSMESADSDNKVTEKPVSIFGLNSQPNSGPKQGAPDMFSSSDSTEPKSSAAPTSIFAPQKPASISGSIFGATSTVSTAKSPFGNNEKTDEGPSVVAKKQAISIFDKPATTTATTSQTEVPSSNVNGKDVSDTRATKSKVQNIFDMSSKGSTTPQAGKLVGEVNHLSPDVQANGADTQSIFNNGPKPTLDLFSRSSNPLFGVGNSNTEASVSTKSIFGQTAKPESTGPVFNNGTPETLNGTNKGNTDSALGLKSLPSTTPSAPIFGMQAGPKPAVSASTTLFGEKKPDESAKVTSSIFSSTPSTNGSIFSLGSQPTSNTNTQTNTQSSTMTFGTTPSPSISFGTLNSQTNGSKPNKIDFQFGSSAPNTSSTPFSFGQDSSSGSSFTFTAGGDKQSVNNPFTASNANSQSSFAPLGGSSSTPTPSSSFNFSFGQQPPSTPKGPPPTVGSASFGGFSSKNGAPSFSFTQATPAQHAPNTVGSKAPGSIFGHLQASGDGSTGASSPFPAPSSIGTTPVNGTPEPQAPNEDGEDAPQEQISLTEGGPGEEDEVILHEIRAKAIKYIPVQKGDEDQEKKSPWSTRGVGLLRVLKNKATGAVRILLRAEPRGHIAINKMILPDVDYKAKEKTVNFVAASDDGSGLETWVLQVKKPEFAQELAGVLEANKSANK